MLTDNDIRLAILNENTRDRIRDLLISTGDLTLMEHIESGYNTSSKIAVMLDVTVQSISVRLSMLYRKKYVSRKYVPQESGGYEFEYTNVYGVNHVENN